MIKPNYDISKLKLETDERGFIIGQSLIGQGIITSTEGSWVDIKGDFNSISLNRGVSVDQGVLFRPETAILTLVTFVDSWADGSYGKTVRLTYGSETLFTGRVKAIYVTDAMDISKQRVRTQVTLTAYDKTENLNNFIWYGWNRPQESAESRCLAAWPDASTFGLDRLMAATPVDSIENPTALQVLQDVADASLARFFVDRYNTVTVDTTGAFGPNFHFWDEPSPPVYYNFADYTTYATTNASVTSVDVAPGYEYWDTIDFYVHPTGTDATVFFPTVPATAGTVYSAGIAVHAQDTTKTYQLRVEWKNAANTTLRTDTYSATGTPANWVFLGIDAMTPPVGATQVRPAIRQTGTAGQDFLIDGLTLTQSDRALSVFETPQSTQVYSQHQSLERQEVIDDAVSSVVAIAKSDETKTAVRTLDGSVITHEERYTVDILSDSISMGAWVDSFPLRGYTSQQPTSMDVKFNEDVLRLDLCELVSIKNKGQVYECGVTGISFNITPERWTLNYQLIPGYVLNHSNIVTPGQVGPLQAYRSSSSILLTWTPPANTGAMDAYEIRMLKGTTPPSNRNAGTLVSSPGAGAAFYNVTGLTPKTDYSFTIWAITDDPTIYSPARTNVSWTEPVTPSVPLSVTATKLSSSSIRINWAHPATGDYSGGYDVVWTGGSSGANRNVSSTATSLTITGLKAGKTYNISVEAKTPTWHGSHFGSGKVTVSKST